MTDEDITKIMTPQEMAQTMQKVVSEHMKLAFRQYKELKEQYGTPNKAVAMFLKSMYPKLTHDLIDSMNNWIDEQLDMVETNLEAGIDADYTKMPDGWVQPKVPSTEELQKLVNDYMKQAFKQYKNLKAQYGTPTKATIDFMKSAYPKNIQDLIENVDKWIEDRTSEMESTVERQIENTEQDSPKKKK